MISINIKERAELEQILAPIINNGFTVYAFGSRVKQQHREYSDLDLLIEGSKPLAQAELYELQEKLEESELPFRVDLSESHKISESFRNCIQPELVKLFPTNV